MQSDQDVHCLPFHLHLLDQFLYGKTSLLEVKGDNSKQFGFLKMTFTSRNLQTDVWFVCLVLNVPVNNFSFMLGRSHRFLGITSTFLGGKYVLPNLSGA